MRTHIKHATTIAAAITLFANTAIAGLPMTCQEFEIGNAKSLPWAAGNRTVDSYDTNRLAADTLELLAPNTPVIVRMETLRRSVFYAGQKSELALDLSGRLMERANNPSPDPLAAFDAGYFIETMHQYSHGRPDPLRGMDGYSLAKRSLSSASDVAAVEYGLALMRALVSWPNDHYRNAVRGAKEGSLLAINLHRYNIQKTIASK
jgi:hypothetical protein